MVQSPSWEANWFAASQEIPRISRNPKVHYRTHERPPPVPILGQPNPVHIPTSHLLEIHPNIIHPSTPRSPQWSPSLRFPPPRLYTPPSPHPYSPRAQPITFFSSLSPAQYWVRSTNHLAPRYAISSIPPVTSSLLGPNILLNTLFSNTLSFPSSRNANGQVSDPYKTAYINRTMSDFWDIFMSLQTRMLKYVPNFFDKIFISHYVIWQKLRLLQRRLIQYVSYWKFHFTWM